MASDRPLTEPELPPLVSRPAPDPLPAVRIESAEEDTHTRKRPTQVSAPVLDCATLTMLTGPSAGRVLVLEQPQTTLGRSSSADVAIPDGGVSRKHVCITRWVGNAFAVEDLGTTNGTFLNGRQITRATLTSGDRLQLGSRIVLRFALTDRSEARLQQRLFEGNVRDPELQVYSRGFLIEQLRLEVAHARRHGTDVALLAFGIDVPRPKDDDGPDQALEQLAARVLETIRIEDLVARTGPAALGVLLRTTKLDGAVTLARRVRASLAGAPLTRGEQSVTASIGIVALSQLELHASSRDLLALAETRLQLARGRGGGGLNQG
jgi:diguanylate cyclase (GGDEF)-like protein